CFDAAVEACRIAVEYRTPVILLSDGAIANGSEPWLLPLVAELPKFGPNFTTDPAGFFPYKRDEKLARAWAIPGTPGLEHRICGTSSRCPTISWPWPRATGASSSPS